MEDYQDIEHKKTNREKRMSPEQGGTYWCDFCDRAIVGHGQKCPACKQRNGKRTLKKETNA
jgi:rubrerythrin